MSAPDLAALLPSWELALRAERKSPNTIRTYGESVRRFLAWCDQVAEVGNLNRATVAAFIASITGEAATAHIRYRSLRRYAAWLAEEGELPSDPLAGMKPPKLDTKIVPKLTEDELKALLKACDGKRLCDRRDEALVRLAVEAICRAEELLSMTVADVDLHRGIATITRGKGGRGRVVPFGSQTARAIDRYLRIRRTKISVVRSLWVGESGRPLSYAGLYTNLRRRADRAGIVHFHPHRLRHTGASRWLDAGGSEGGLMAVAGWSSRDMLARYVQDTAAERAADESRKLNLGDL
jgi:site-specific recombinase XerD